MGKYLTIVVLNKCTINVINSRKTEQSEMNCYQNEAVKLIELVLEIFRNQWNRIFLAYPLKAC